MDDCIEWWGARNGSGRNNYGITRYRGGKWQAHRMVWTECFGEIPEGMFVLHHCDNPPCVNPAHLFLGTNLDNMRDMQAKGRKWYGTNGNENKTHCPHGHPYDEANTSVGRDGKRRCRTCAARRGREWRSRQKG